ncbi:MAG TPA: sigma-70 family RNA polymerase sigma factor [Acidimicrobiia bacterium]|nr:sigma-70 family RNA polymerase sigma factor [Acidimicrobiia bacterium]
MEQLCLRLATDLDEAFPDLVRWLQDDLFSGLRPLAGSEAEDLTQETFIRAYRALASYPSQRILELRLRGWIWTIALNLGRNHVRDHARRPQLAVDGLDRATSDPEPPDLEAWERRLGRLSVPIRRAVVLRHVVGLDYDEIAEALNRPEGTVKADVHRGLQRLRLIMENEQ